jgi:hypothetical protein
VKHGIKYLASRQRVRRIANAMGGEVLYTQRNSPKRKTSKSSSIIDVHNEGKRLCTRDR